MQLSSKTQYAFVGAAFGFVFPLVAWTLDIASSDLAFTPATVILIHQNNFLHYIIDLAPFILSLSFFYVAVSRQVISESEMMLRKHADRVTLLLNSTGEAIYGIDLNGACTFANAVCIEILGYQSEADLLGKNMHELIHHTHNDGSPYAIEKCKIFRAFKLGVASHVDDEVLWRKNGTSFDSEYRSIPMREAGEIIGSVVSFTDITERKALERDREQIGAELAQLIENANAPIFGLNSRMQINEWNLAAERITGYTKNDVMGHLFINEFIDDAFKTGVSRIFEDALVGTETSNFELYIRTKKGEIAQVLFNTTTRRDLTGEITGVIGIGQDLTDTITALAEAERVAADMTQLVENANAPIFGIDTVGHINEWNLAATEIIGYSKQEVMGRDLVEEFISQEYRTAVKEVLDKALQGIDTANYEFPMFTKDGGRVEILLNASARRNQSGAIVGVIGVGQDVTALIQSIAEREQVATNLTLLLDTVNVPIFGIDASGMLNEWNRQAAEITGYSKEEVMGLDMVSTIFPREHSKKVRTMLAKALRGEASVNVEIPVCLKDGDTALLLFNATTQRDLDGNIVGVIGVAQDITELRAQENALNQAQKLQAVGQLTGGIAHDFNNLLSIIGGNLRFLRQDIGDLGDELNELFEDAQSAVNDGAELTQRLLGFSRLRTLQPQLKNVNETIPKFVRFLSRTLGENVSLRVVLPERPLCINVDPAQLENALLNLTINARDALSERGQLIIRVEAVHIEKGGGTGAASFIDGDFVKISVIDTGEGIAPADIDRVFEPFFTTKEVGKGSGLGLSMVYGFTQQSGGACTISSTLGQGTTVSMFLPEVKGTSMDNTETKKVNSTPPEDETILVVEDEPRVRRVATRDLENLGYSVVEAKNAEMAIKVLESEGSVNLLFTDVLMPGVMDGRDLAEWTIEHYPDIKILLTSGFSKSNSDSAVKEPRPLPMLRKPYAIDMLARQIRSTMIGRTPDISQ